MTPGPAAGEAPLCLPPGPVTRPPLRPLPPGSVDTHFHVFAAGASLAVPRSYTPPVCTLADWLALADALGIGYGVVVQPSVYGFDNSVLLAALAAALDRLRGIAVLRSDVADGELERLHSLGVRGIRCNTRNMGGLALDAVTALARRIAPLGWSIQFQVRPEQLDGLAELVPALPPMPVIIDHLGFTDPREAGVAARLQRLLDAGSCYVKLSAPYRLSRTAGWPEVARVARALVASHPERLLWGSDWPHTELWDTMVDDSDMIDATESWLGSGSVRDHVFVLTPRRLFF